MVPLAWQPVVVAIGGKKEHDDYFAYVTNVGSNNVSGYAIDASSGALTPVSGSPFAAGTEPYGVSIQQAQLTLQMCTP